MGNRVSLASISVALGLVLSVSFAQAGDGRADRAEGIPWGSSAARPPAPLLQKKAAPQSITPNTYVSQARRAANETFSLWGSFGAVMSAISVLPDSREVVAEKIDHAIHDDDIEKPEPHEITRNIINVTKEYNKALDDLESQLSRYSR